MQELIDQVIEFSSKKNHSKDFLLEQFHEFVKIFYLQNQVVDFDSYTTEELYEAALISFKFFTEKKNKDFKVEVIDLSDLQDEESEYEISNVFVNVVNDDRPFLVDSIVAHLDKSEIAIKNIVHPIFHAIRDKNGKLKEISEKESANQESVIQIHLESGYPRANIKKLEQEISKIVETVNLAVGDWQGMIDFAKEGAKQIAKAKNLKKKASEVNEIKDFISWITDGNFIFLGAIEFDIKENKKGEYQLHEVKDSALGVFKSKYEEFKPTVANSSVEEVGDSVKNPFVIEVIKSRYKSVIHRYTNAERIRVQKISEDGKVVGEFRFIGLFTSSAYNHSPNSIPLVKGKIADVIANSGFIKGSHNYKDLVSTLESYPRDELFQIDEKDLLRISTGIVAICGRSQVRFFARKDKYNRFVSCLIFTPRDRSNSDLREKVKSYLAEVYEGVVTDSFVQITESKLIRFHVIIRTENGIPKVKEDAIEKEITKMVRIWKDDLKEAIKVRYDYLDTEYLYNKYKDSFSVSYVNRFNAKRGAIDISLLEECLETKETLFYLHKSENFLMDNLSELKIYNPDKELQLSDMMPVLESFGFNMIQEYTYCVSPAEMPGDKKPASKVYIHYFQINFCKNENKFSARSKNNFEKLVTLIWKGVATTTPLNKLVPIAELTWKQIYMLSAYTKYLYQAGFRYSQANIAETLSKYSELTKLLVDLFEVKFNTAINITPEDRIKVIKFYCLKIEEELGYVTDINSDVIIRRLFNIIKATLRTNYYQTDEKGGFKEYMSFKFDCKQITDLPLPIPHAEIFVYSAKVEGIHLRGGKVARGGLRWSDRHEDFRTEVLGLVKAQMTKNAVIVPVGSKGGFVVKKPIQSMTRAEYNKEGVECYKTFLRGILDITDNVINGEVEYANCVTYDEADPYLVVAADKGTATFSDIANSISSEYNFWLGDAFASGGSVGYDHKKMGITAKGGWVSVMRHFREMGVDTQSQDFTCVGIGDLAGDVFGNGMLLSKHIKLVAAFNHLHIFLDPNPDAAESYNERVRMFNLQGSSWLDYDKSKISKGGGIFERTSKVIPLSAEVKDLLNIEEDELTPKALIKAILKAKVDLLWNGGIGTYVKASDESNEEVGDRANDDLRIEGKDLRCKVVGEGGNLGFTQKGRIEYAMNGGRINTDAMDNSAGVDCSDHEVNIKIALVEAVLSKKITLEERNKTLEQMTENVSDLVLADNRLQTQAISIALSKGVSALEERSQFLTR
ncbi:MAG: NAD-glutamate dehydrogenase, partial [Pelagibacterales bacterium]|nr:NAD-glutamate dehydrogenase [Pelagibacterales bacterium]